MSTKNSGEKRVEKGIANAPVVVGQLEDTLPSEAVGLLAFGVLCAVGVVKGQEVFKGWTSEHSQSCYYASILQ